MTEGCDYEQEGFCLLEDMEGKIEPPCHLKDAQGNCTARPEDLTEFCEDCGEPVSNCDCGIRWILVMTRNGKIVPLTPRKYHEATQK